MHTPRWASWLPNAGSGLCVLPDPTALRDVSEMYYEITPNWDRRLIVDVLRLPEATRSAYLHDALALGFLERAALYRLDVVLKSDLGLRARTAFDSADEAASACGRFQRARLSALISEIDDYRAGPRLLEQWHRCHSEPPPLILVEELALVTMVERCGDVPGVWWSELTLAELRSAPRGIVFEAALRACDVEAVEIETVMPTGSSSSSCLPARSR